MMMQHLIHQKSMQLTFDGEDRRLRKQRFDYDLRLLEVVSAVVNRRRS